MRFSGGGKEFNTHMIASVFDMILCDTDRSSSKGVSVGNCY